MFFRSVQGSMCVFSLAIAFAVGCGGAADAPRAAVEGTVTVNGTRVDVGAITFTPTGDTSGPVAGGTISEGRFAISAAEGPVIGTNMVQIMGQQKTGKIIEEVLEDEAVSFEEMVDIVPPKYSHEGELIRTIEPGTNVLDFELTGQ